MPLVHLYDTTLRDGAQAEKISFSLEDKLRIAARLDEFGIDYIEGGWPGSNPKDMEFFNLIRGVPLRRARICAFGSTAHPKYRPADDPNLRALIATGTSTVTIFGKSWDLHVTEALRIGLDVNLRQIEASVRFLKQKKREVIYDAEHFFDAYYANPDYAMATIRSAAEGGADCIVLCETNGGRLPHEVSSVVETVQREISTPLGIHAHNDAETGVANSIAAVRAGCVHVQGTVNGIGERCGNANLCSIVPALALKMGYRTTLSDAHLRKLSDLSHYISEMANLTPNHRQPYVGASAFAHKGGIHVSAVQRNPRTYEHIDPALVGNARRVLVSELSGRSNVYEKAKQLGYKVKKDNPALKTVLERVKTLESAGFEFEAADGSFELLLKRALEPAAPFFEVLGFRVINERENSGGVRCEATIKVRVGDREEHTAADGNGPVNAMDNALRKALEKFYPELTEVHLTDFKVRVLDATAGTGAQVRVLIEFSDGRTTWNVVGASENVIDASWQAILDGIEYKLYRSRKKKSR
ncbi:citramalate synthase [bacterium]|nr:citramalate synthase [bacterium]